MFQFLKETGPGTEVVPAIGLPETPFDLAVHPLTAYLSSGDNGGSRYIISVFKQSRCDASRVLRRWMLDVFLSTTDLYRFIFP